MNNLLSYCGLVDAKIRASDKDLPVHSVDGGMYTAQYVVWVNGIHPVSF